MTYIVRIWESPADRSVPDSIDSTCKLLVELEASQPLGGNPKFVSLARRLTQRFPTPDMSPGADGDDGDNEVSLADIAWCDWPITGKTDAAVWNLGINAGRLDDVRPFVMQEANGLGLCVMDEQAGEVYLPTGNVLCLPGRAPAVKVDSKYDDVPQTREVLARIYERLAPLLIERGFKGNKRNLTFRRVFPDGWHDLKVFAPAERWPLCAEAAVYVTARFHAISDLVATISNPEQPLEAYKDTYTLLGHPRNWIEGDDPFLTKLNKYYQVRSYSEIDTVLDHLCSNLRMCVLPALDACRTVEDFDRALNPPPGVRSFFNGTMDGTKNIIAAYLARSPFLNDICREYDPRLHGRWEPDVANCIDYVLSHPLAISNG